MENSGRTEETIRNASNIRRTV